MYNRNKKAKRYRIDMVAIACCVVFFATFIVYTLTGEVKGDSIKASSDNSSSQDKNNGNNSDTPADSTPGNDDSKSQPDTNPSEIKNPVSESQLKDSAYFDDCVFVGDSLSVGLAGYKYIPTSKVLASIGLNINKIDTEKLTTSDGEMTVYDAIVKKQPKKIYIMLGSNGIAFLSNKTMIDKYSAFIDKIRSGVPSAQIVILSIPPVTTEREKATSNKILNSDIDVYNSELLKLANEKNVHFVDINTSLKNNAGKLDTDKAEKDGIHFKKPTYQTMIDYILSHTI